MSTTKLTPMMEQYYEIKAKYPDFILFFRLGDFYEMFEDDALLSSRLLGITLTQRNNQRMCGIPYHALDNYLYKAIKAGQKVAICEQVELPGKNKIVKREVVELVTPGTFTDNRHLNQLENSYLSALHVTKDTLTLAAADASTGKFILLQDKFAPDKLSSWLKMLSPSEIILDRMPENLKTILSPYYHTIVPEYYFAESLNEVLLLDHFKVGTLKGIGLHNENSAAAAGAILRYLRDNLFKEIKHLNNIRFVPPASTLYLPESTIRNLELLEPLFTDQNDTSLLSHLNKTQTSMGARELRSWLTQPLLDQKLIEERQEQVAFFLDQESLEQETRQLLKQVPDLERLLAKITLHKAHPKEIIAFKEGLVQLEKLKALPLPFPELSSLPALTTAIEQIEKTVHDDPPVQFDEGGVIREGFDPQLDEYKALTTKGKEYLLEIEEREKNKTGLSKLRLRYNKVIGYYFEISKTQAKDIPDYFIRKQSLVGSERYTIDDLISFETKILDAKSRLVELERKLYIELLQALTLYIETIQSNLDYLKKVDILCSFSFLARINRYTRPRLHQQGHLLIEDGRHPVVETFVERFTANSVYLDQAESRLILLTGPNMAGKSTYLRQTALIVLMAHLGSFVPASRAEIPLTDQIFTRIGASDNLAGGESTFLVEMSETSQILRNTTEKSLIIMDEVGRGTSTHDGLSLAWAIVEHLCESGVPRGKTLFATHYHELTVLGQEKGIQNLRMAVQEWKNQIVFLHKVEAGAADKSYGIHVAEIAGIPSSVISRAQEILSSMEISLLSQEKTLLKNEINTSPSLFAVENDPFAKIKSQLLSLDLQHTTPLQALVFLEEIQEKLRKK